MQLVYHRDGWSAYIKTELWSALIKVNIRPFIAEVTSVAH